MEDFNLKKGTLKQRLTVSCPADPRESLYHLGDQFLWFLLRNRHCLRYHYCLSVAVHQGGRCVLQ